MTTHQDQCRAKFEVACKREAVSVREHLEQRMDLMDKARELQAAEYERRLDGLNHENARILAVQNSSVTREKFDDYVRQQETALELARAQMGEKIEALALKVNSMSDRREGTGSVWKLLAGIAALVIAASSVIVLVLR